MAADQAEAHRIAILESLFRDEEKDITFQLADGQECAHKAILKAASEVFAQMLSHDMQEKATNVISLPDVSKKVMRVFLRLVYSGSVDESDWADGEVSKEQQGEPGPLVLKHAHMRVEGSRLTSTSAGWQSCALLSGGGVGDFTFTVRAEQWQSPPGGAGTHVMLGIAPVDCALCVNLYSTHGFYGYANNGSLHTVHAQDGTGGKALTVLSQLPPGAEITVKFEAGALHFAVNGDQFVPATFNTPIPSGVNYAPAVSCGSANAAMELVSCSATPKVQCPLGILVGVASLAKKYMVTSVLRMCTLVLKQRVAAAKSRKDVGSFEQVMAAAICNDLGSVRMAALKAAEEFAELRSQYEAGSLSPDVSQDLEAIWPPPAMEQRKPACLS